MSNMQGVYRMEPGVGFFDGGLHDFLRNALVQGQIRSGSPRAAEVGLRSWNDAAFLDPKGEVANYVTLSEGFIKS